VNGNGTFTVKGNSSNWGTTGYSITNSACIVKYNTVASTWTAELRVPLRTTAGSGGTQWIDVGATPLIYFNVLRNNGTTPEYLTWPRYRKNLIYGPMNDILDILTYSYPPAEWGDATISTTNASGGVFLNWGDEGTEVVSNPLHDKSHIIWGAQNTFFANVQNNTIVNGAPTQADGVVANFRIAQWGIGSAPIVIPSDDAANYPNPTNPATIPANGAHEFNTLWTPTDTSYKVYPNCHQCIWVDLTAPPNTVITIPSVQWNMDFVADDVTITHICDPTGGGPGGGAGGGDGKGAIGTDGQGDPPEGGDKHEVIVEVEKEEYVKDVKTGDEPKKTIDPEWVRYFIGRDQIFVKQPVTSTTRSYVRWVARGHIFTGKYVTIRGKQYKLYKPMGSFGYAIQHVGEVAGWEDKVTGDKVQKIGPHTYKIMLPKDSRTNFDVEIHPVVLNGWSASIHGALSVPLGSLASNAGLGGALIADVGYQLFPGIALVLQAGINCFLPPSSAGATSWMINVSADVRFTLFRAGPLNVYAGPGGSILYHDSGAIDYGANACAGVDCRVATRFDVELGVMYHYLAPNNAQLLQISLGGVYRF
jgi:hypothetical protein